MTYNVLSGTLSLYTTTTTRRSWNKTGQALGYVNTRAQYCTTPDECRSLCSLKLNVCCRRSQHVVVVSRCLSL